MKCHGNGKRTIYDEIEKIRLLLEYLDVDTSSGICTWKKSPSQRIKIGDFAGTKKPKGYVQIEFMTQNYYRHRIVFYVAHGYLPLIVDHKHGVEDGDGIDNLQEATNQQNCAKQNKSKNNTSGVKGVSWQKSRNKWIANININGKQKNLGRFDTIEEAQNAYNQKAKEIFGEFYNEKSNDKT